MTINEFRIGMAAATVLTCGLAIIFTFPVWIVGEIVYIMEGDKSD